jgi:hypothetical protein
MLRIDGKSQGGSPQCATDRSRRKSRIKIRKRVKSRSKRKSRIVA